MIVKLVDRLLRPFVHDPTMRQALARWYQGTQWFLAFLNQANRADELEDKLRKERAAGRTMTWEAGGSGVKFGGVIFRNDSEFKAYGGTD